MKLASIIVLFSLTEGVLSAAAERQLRLGRDKTEAEEESCGLLGCRRTNDETTSSVEEGDFTDGDRSVYGCEACVNSEMCISSTVGFLCRCDAGYERVDSLNCENVNECLVDDGGCPHGCEDTDGSFICTCPEGYTLNADSHTCDDIDECAGHPCESPCLNFKGGYVCGCTLGFRTPSPFDSDPTVWFGESLVEMAESDHEVPEDFAAMARGVAHERGLVCEDIDECHEHYDACAPEMVCENEEGGYACMCHGGFEFGEEVTEDDDAAGDDHEGDHGHRLLSDSHDDEHDSVVEHEASEGEKLHMVKGAHGLESLLHGHVIGRDIATLIFEGVKISCVDINECDVGLSGGANPCDASRFPCCRNTLGGYECEKTKGLKRTCPDGSHLFE